MERTAIIEQSGDRRIGWIKEFSRANCPEHSLEELCVSLTEALQDILEFHG
ncbi:MAG: hypothetical protein OXF66_08160 [Gammaproteobacteria bacterium]|nr:hypothetical protein [Gammaproteobacteria bacterium]MCY4255981.1 hypothetical protein [Gammaproteobacteria bacterium]MCY4341088.1 hypothetical protein [Gammaproteobacteria bacterium]